MDMGGGEKGEGEMYRQRKMEIESRRVGWGERWEGGPGGRGHGYTY